METSFLKTVLNQIESGEITLWELDAVLKVASISELEQLYQAAVRNQIKKQLEKQLEKTEF